MYVPEIRVDLAGCDWSRCHADQVIGPTERCLACLTAIECSTNTVRAYAVSLMLSCRC
jgi:hypothetical protein